MVVSINGKELENILEFTPENHNILLIGKHGIGKSEILSNFFRQQNTKVVSLFLGQMSDPGDIIGLPYKDKETGKTNFMPPYWFPTDNQPIVLFLDELNRARPEILQTVMDLALNRTLAGKKLPDNSRIISAINEGDEYQLTELDPALVSRFNAYNFKPTVSEWVLWASSKKIDNRVITFIQKYPDTLDGNKVDSEDSNIEKTPDRRAWVRVSDVIKNMSNLNSSDKKLISGIIGLKTAVSFFEYLSKNEIVSAHDLLYNFSKHKTAISKYKLHQLSIINESIFNYLETTEISDTDNKKVVKNLTSYVDFLTQKKQKKEAFAHFASMFEQTSYNKSIAFIVINLPELHQKIVDFIQEI